MLLLRKSSLPQSGIIHRFYSSTANHSKILIGKKLPINVQLDLHSPSHKINVSDHFSKYDRSLLIGVPGAFTPGCSQHVPSFLKHYSDIVQRFNLSYMACVSVNDPYVMKSWGESMNAEGKIDMLSDPRAEFVTSLGLNWDDAANILGTVRSKRFVILLEGNTITDAAVEPHNSGLTCTLADHIMKNFK